MLKLLATVTAGMSILLVATTHAQVREDTHEKVQQALDWELPDYSCERPKPLAMAPADNPIGVGLGAGLSASGSLQGVGATISYDVDYVMVAAHERKEKRWKTCDQAYRDGLMADFVELKNSAQYGLTEQQAQTILTKLALIQSTILGTKTPDTTE